MSVYRTTGENDELLARLREVLAESDTVPSDVTSFATAAFTWRIIDAQLAEFDHGGADEELLAGLRCSVTARMISFQAGQWMLDVEYDEIAERLMGHISPRAVFTVELHSAGALFNIQSDQRGRFEAIGVSPGPLSMTLRFGDGTVIKTQWIVLS